MIGFQRFCLSNKVRRVVNGDDLTFSGYTHSQKPFSITVKLSDANEWINGGMIQSCFGYLSAEDREILMTGNDNESWDKMFGDIDDATED
jgi:hypothetical protein